MTADIDELLPSATDMMKELALAEAKRASEQMRRIEKQEAEKEALIAQLSRPSGVSDEEGVRRGAKLIRAAINSGLMEIQVYRFPNTLCTDHGRAINQAEPGWENTLTGIPKEIYQLWYKYFRPRGYKLRAEIVSFPGGVPGDVGMTLSWR